MEKKYSAEDWRNGTYLRGETFHLWLTELSLKYNIDYGVVSCLYNTSKEHYCQMNKILDTKLRNKDYVQISRDLEDYLEAFQKEQEQTKRLSQINQRQRQLRFAFKILLQCLLFWILIVIIALWL